MRLPDVAHEGSRARDRNRTLDVADRYRPVLARMRTSRRLSGCLPHEPLLGLFDEQPGTRHRRR
jgi:hypothetical protein